MKDKFYSKTILLLLACSALLIFIIRLLFVFSYLPETGGMSVNMLYSTQHLMQTGVLYINPESAPFSITQYMPLHYYIVCWIAKISGIDNVHQLMVIHRMICLLCNVAYCYIVYKAIRKFFPSADKFIALSGGLTLFIIVPIINFSRLDNLYLLFHLAALFTFLSYLKKKESSSYNIKELVYTSLFCALALLTKQTAVLVSGFIGLWLLLIQKNIKHTIIFGITTFIDFSIGLWLFMPADLLDFKMNVVNGLQNGVNLLWFYHSIVKDYYLTSGLLLAFGIYIATQLWQKKAGISLFLSLSILYFFTAGTLLALKAGSGPNYYIEFTICVALGVGFLADKKPECYRPYLPFILLLLPFFLLPYANDKGWKSILHLNKAKADYQTSEKVAAYIKSHLKEGNYILTDFHTESCINLQLSEVALFPCREVAVRFTYPIGVFHFMEFDKLVKDGKVQYYIESKSQHKEKFLKTSLSGFEPDTIIGKYAVYRWKY